MFDSHKIDAYFNGDRSFDNVKLSDKPQTSRWLRFVKLGFPCVAAALLGVMIVMPNIKKSVDLQDSATLPRKNELEKLHIEQTVYNSTDNKNRVSTVTADSVDEVAPGSKEIKISNPRGLLPTDSGVVNVKSDNGFFVQDANILTLEGNVVAEDEKNTLVTTEKASFDFKKDYGYGNNPINGSGEWGTLNAEGFEYYKNDNILVLKGRHNVVSAEGTLTAQTETRYFQNEHKSVSTGDVVIQQGENQMYADKVVVYYTPKNELKKAEAYGDVRIVTPKGKAFGQKGFYNPQTSVVSLHDNVRLEQDGNVINGSKAETNLKTQISRIIADKKSGKRITGTFYNKKDN